MARATTSTLIVMTTVLAVLLNMTAPAAAIDRTCKKAGEFCGGIVGFQCCEGLECILDGDYADAGGECKPTGTTSCPMVGEFCGGIAGIECCRGLQCVLDADYGESDAGGICTKGSSYEQKY